MSRADLRTLAVAAPGRLPRRILRLDPHVPFLRRPSPRGRRRRPGVARVRRSPTSRPGSPRACPWARAGRARGQRRHGCHEPGQRPGRRGGHRGHPALPHRAHPVPPSAVLGAVIVYAASKLIDPAQWRSLARSSRAEVGHRRHHVLVRHQRSGSSRRSSSPSCSPSPTSSAGRHDPPTPCSGGLPVDDRYVDVFDQPDAGVTRGGGRLPDPGPIVLRQRALLQTPPVGRRGRGPQAGAARDPRRLLHQ